LSRWRLLSPTKADRELMTALKRVSALVGTEIFLIASLLNPGPESNPRPFQPMQEPPLRMKSATRGAKCESSSRRIVKTSMSEVPWSIFAIDARTFFSVSLEPDAPLTRFIASFANVRIRSSSILSS